MKVASVIHVFGLYVLLNSSLPMSIQIGTSFVLIASIMQIARSRIPVPAFAKLSYHKNYWLLHGIHGNEIRYERAYISFDAGLFFLLTLANDDLQKKLVVFNDQLTNTQYWALNVIGKISAKKK